MNKQRKMTMSKKITALYYLEVFIDPHGEYSYIFDNLDKIKEVLKKFELTEIEIFNLVEKNGYFGDLTRGDCVRDTFMFRKVENFNLDLYIKEKSENEK